MKQMLGGICNSAATHRLNSNAAQSIAGILAGKIVELNYNFRNETSHSAKSVLVDTHSSSEIKRTGRNAGDPVIMQHFIHCRQASACDFLSKTIEQ